MNFRRSRWLLGGGLALIVALLALGLIASGTIQSIISNASGNTARASVSGGDQLNGTPAPNFSLSDQFGHPQQLSQFRGKVVVLAFIDSRCTDTCPLTAAVLTQTMTALGSQAANVQLLAVNANPIATKVSDVLKWSNQHQMTKQWLFVTGPVTALKTIWADYHVDSQVEPNGDVSHTPAVYVIDKSGHERWLNLMDNTKTSMPQETTNLVRQVEGLVGN